MKNPLYLILFLCVLFACTKDEIEEIEDFSGDSGTFTDSRDGHVYKWLRIGDQIWMAENLAFLPSVYPPEYGSYTELGYYVYGYTGSDTISAKQNANYTIYGVLYNWSASLSASPTGWHLPSDEEWKQLEMQLGMTQIQVELTGFRGNEQGLHLKATSTWEKYGSGTNTSGFTALAGGLRGISEGFINLGISGYWWSATENSSLEAWDRGLYWSNFKVNRYHMNKDYGFSVRCIKD